MFACNSPDDRYPWQSSFGCASAFSPIVTLTSISVSISGVVGSLSQTVESDGGMNAYSVQVRFKSGDFPAVTTVTTTVHTSTTTTLPIPVTTTVRTSTTTTLPVPGVTTTIPAPDIDLLSPSALAGAACSAAIFGIALLASLVYFYIRRLHSRRILCDRLVPHDPQERSLLADSSISYRTTGRAAARGESPPPAYSG